MVQIKAFRKANKISQAELAEYLNVTQGLVSQFEKGITNVSTDVLEKLISNPNGWDYSMLLGDNATIHQKGKTNVFGACNNVLELGLEELINEKDQQIAELKAQLAEEKARSERYLTMIEKLMEK